MHVQALLLTATGDRSQATVAVALVAVSALLLMVQAALKRFQLDYVDLVFCHCPESHTSFEDTVHAINFVIEQGWAFYWGTFTWSPRQITEVSHALLRTHDKGLLVCVYLCRSNCHASLWHVLTGDVCFSQSSRQAQGNHIKVMINCVVGSDFQAHKCRKPSNSSNLTYLFSRESGQLLLVLRRLYTVSTNLG